MNSRLTYDRRRERVYLGKWGISTHRSLEPSGGDFCALKPTGKRYGPRLGNFYKIIMSHVCSWSRSNDLM